MNISIVGCGYVSDFYLKTIQFHKNINLLGCFDKDASKSSIFAKVAGIKSYNSLEDTLKDPECQIILNLTNPKDHYDINKMALNMGKHVYSEKPLAISMHQLKELAELAKNKKLYIFSAPCIYLSESILGVKRIIENNVIGEVKLVYFEMDDGFIYKQNYKSWKNSIGFYWPYEDEFEMGCVIEHAGYCTSILTMLFGPAKSISSLSSCLIPDKTLNNKTNSKSNDFSLACIEFRNNIIARVTCSTIAPKNHSFKVIGSQGLVEIENCWDYSSSIYLKKINKYGEYEALDKIDLDNQHKSYGYNLGHNMDFSRGVSFMIDAIENKKPAEDLIDFFLHNNELVLAMENHSDLNKKYNLTTRFQNFL